MKLLLLLDISKTLLLARLNQTLLAAMGVTFSIAMFITLMSFMTGLNAMLDGLILNRTPHIRLYNEIRKADYQPVDIYQPYSDKVNFVSSVKPRTSRIDVRNSEAIIKALREDNRVRGIAPKVVTQVFYTTGTVDINGVLNGIDVTNEQKLFSFDDYLVAGKAIDLERVDNSIILGAGVAEKLSVETGDVMNITTSKGGMFTLKVVGIMQQGLAELDNTHSYASLKTAQKLVGETAGYVTDIQVKLHDLEQAPEMAEQYSQLFKVDAIDIQQANAQFETGTSIRNLITYAVSITLLVVSGFGIYNILNMMIYEKMDSIAILKATGFSGSDVQWVFIQLSLIIGTVGGSVGLMIGFALTNLIDKIPFETDALPTIKTYPINFDPTFYLTGIIFAMITTYIAGWFPARKASRVDPVVIIRGK